MPRQSVAYGTVVISFHFRVSFWHILKSNHISNGVTGRAKATLSIYYKQGTRCILLPHVKAPISITGKVNGCCKRLNSICAKTSASQTCTGKQAVFSRGWNRGWVWISSWLSVLIKCSECEKLRCCLSFPMHSARYSLFIDDTCEISKWKVTC